MLSNSRRHHRTVVVGGGAAGVTVAARLQRAGEHDVGVVEPSSKHWYQPLWTLVGGGTAPLSASVRPQTDVMPRGVYWIRDRVVTVDPDAQTVRTLQGAEIGYDYLVVAPGITYQWGQIPGLTDALGGEVSSNYGPDLAVRTWELIRDLRGGTAVFTAPADAIKCGGAPQKIAYLAADWWRRQGVLGDIHVIFATTTDSIFGVPEFRAVLERVVERYGIDVRFQHELTAVDPGGRKAMLADRSAGTEVTIDYDVMHVVPPQAAPDWLASGALADPASPGGFVEVDQYTLQHPRYPNVFALGDAAGTPNSKTGAAVRKQAPVVVANLRALMAGREPEAQYDGYSSCPIVTARNRMLLAEFDYSGKPHPTVPLIDTQRERYDMWLLKRYGLPFAYWNLMLRGRM